MTHYAINYTNTDRAVNDANAIRDAIEYLDRARWAASFGKMVQPGASMRSTPYSEKKKLIQQIRIGCMFAGIRGYPVGAIMRGMFAAHP